MNTFQHKEDKVKFQLLEYLYEKIDKVGNLRRQNKATLLKNKD